MRTKLRIGFWAGLLLLAGCTSVPQVELRTVSCADMPVGRAASCACVCDGKAYIFAGRGDGGEYRNDLWQYYPQTDCWTDLGAAPMDARVNAVIASEGGKIYAGMGYSAVRAYKDSAFMRDWWEYTPETKQWKRLADYPKSNTVAARAYVLDGNIYVLYGFDYGFTRDVYRYDIAADRWILLPDNLDRAKRCFGANGAMQGNMLYFGTGFNTYNLTQWFAADLGKDYWQACAPIPGKGRQWSACAANGRYIYLFGGRHFAGEMSGGEVFATFMRYAPDKDKWEWCGTMPCGSAENQIAFCIDDKVYFGLGEDGNGQLINKLYCIEE